MAAINTTLYIEAVKKLSEEEARGLIEDEIRALLCELGIPLERVASLQSE